MNDVHVHECKDCTARWDEDVVDDEALGLLRRVYEMLRDSTPGPIGDDAPVRVLLREARTFLDAHGT